MLETVEKAKGFFRRKWVRRTIMAVTVPLSILSIALSVEIGISLPSIMGRLSQQRAGTERLLAEFSRCRGENRKGDDPSPEEARTFGRETAKCVLAAAEKDGRPVWLWWEIAMASAPRGHEWEGREALVSKVFEKGASSVREELEIASSIERGLPVTSSIVSVLGQRMPFVALAQTQRHMFLKTSWEMANPAKVAGLLEKGPEGMVLMESMAAEWAGSEEGAKALSSGRISANSF